MHGYTVRFHLYTSPGQVFYNATRRLMLRGCDGVAFVADSQENRLDANLESIENLRDNLADHAIDFATIPMVVQYNKRDLPTALPVESLRAAINHAGWPEVEAVARDGLGVFDTFKRLSRSVLHNVRRAK